MNAANELDLANASRGARRGHSVSRSNYGGPRPRETKQYHVFVASPGDVNDERQVVRAFFRTYNLNYAELRGLNFEVVDWENYSSAGVGRPQELITEQTLERYRESLALVVGIMAQRFGSKSGTHESGTEEEFEWALSSYAKHGFPEVKWFFRDAERLSLDPSDLEAGLAQWRKVEAFRKRIDTGKTVYFRSYKDLAGFKALLENDIGRWLNSPERPWFRPGPPPAGLVPEWPQHIVERLATQLGDEFDYQMRAGEDVSPDQARSRYIQGVLKLRGGPDDRTTPARSRESLAAQVKSQNLVKEGPLEDFLTSEGLQLLVVGAGGSGKSTMLKHLASDGARRAAQDASAPVFLYLRLASFDRDDGGFDLLLDRLSMAGHLDRNAFQTLWREGPRPIVFLLDGFNEVAQSCQPSCARALGTFLQSSPPLHKSIITSRPGGQFEATSGHSSDNQRLQVADILEFKPEQIRKYLEAQGRGELRSRISGPLQALASNPFLLWAITRTIVSSRGAAVNNRGSLFKALIDRHIFEEREHGKPRPRPTDYNYQLVKKPVLAQLALEMNKKGVTDVRDDPRLWKRVSNQLVALEKEHYRALPLEAEIFMPKDYAAATLLREAMDNGVIVRDGDRLRFMHESVQEYFAAVALSTSTVEDIVRQAPLLNFTQLDARGPMFETLVTWVGLVEPGEVTALSERLEDRHPLLAAHLMVEAGLSDGELHKLRHQFLSYTKSQHEQRRRLGAMGLAVAPSDEPEVIFRLIELLDNFDLANVAEGAFNSRPTRTVLSTLVETALGSEKIDNNQARILKRLIAEHRAPVAEILLDKWRGPSARQNRVAQLAAFLDAKESWEKNKRQLIRDTLIALSVNEEMKGDPQKSADLDALRERADKIVLPNQPSITAAALHAAVEAQTASDPKRRKLSSSYAAYAKKDDADLALLVRNADGLQRDLALHALVERGSPAAMVPLLDTILANPVKEWLEDLELLPQDLVRQCLAQFRAVESKSRERAQLLAGILADPPPRTVLERAFREHSKGLRAFAARAAIRAGAEGIELLMEELGNEANGDVLEACIRALGESGDQVAVNRLIDLLLEPGGRRYWPDCYAEPDLDSAPRIHHSIGEDRWAILIHQVLANARAVDRILERLEDHLRLGRPRDRLSVIHEAQRCLPNPRAFELLRRALTDNDPYARYWAQWSLACTGNIDAWRTLLQTELEAQPDFVGLAQDAARRLEAITTDAATRDLLIAESQATLRPALADRDYKRRGAALQLISRLPEQWVEEAWRREVLATAEQLLQTFEWNEKHGAIRAIHRFAEDGNDRIFAIFTNDPDDAVIQAAYRMLGDEAFPRVEEQLRSALQLGDVVVAQRLAPLVRIHGRERTDGRELAGKWLDDGSCAQCAAAFLTLAALYGDYEREEDWVDLFKRARIAFQRHGTEEIWQRISTSIKSLDESRRAFIYQILYTLDESLDRLVFFLAELWPDDIEILAISAGVDIQRGRRAEASERLDSLQALFPERISRTWLAARYAELDRPQDALRHLRLAVDRDPTSAEAHFAVGWYAFIVGEFEASIASTQRSVELQPTNAMAYFNLGLALLAQQDVAAAEATYRRGLAFVRRQAQADARSLLDDALGDFPRLPELPDATKDAVERIRSSLRATRDRLETGCETHQLQWPDRRKQAPH